MAKLLPATAHVNDSKPTSIAVEANSTSHKLANQRIGLSTILLCTNRLVPTHTVTPTMTTQARFSATRPDMMLFSVD
jgi:hypothetical protein